MREEDSVSGPVLVENLTWPQLARLVERGESLCVLPVGALEQHGRHLPTVTDTLIARSICEAASDRTRVPVLPTLWLTSSQAHTAKWPGTFAVTPRMLIETVVQVARWVRSSGFTKLLIVNAHGGNSAALRVAVDEIRSASEIQIGTVNWYELTPAIARSVTTDGEDVHANKAETALVMHLRPDLVDRDAIGDDPDRTVGRVFSYTVAQTSRDGVTGSPSEATTEEGKRLFEEVVAALSGRIERARAEELPSL